MPQRAAQRILERQGLPVPEGDINMAQGIAIPVLILLAVALVMTVIAQRTRFGRYVFAIGGNPEAAELSGIDTRMLTVKVFALMGALTAIAAVIASARLNAGANDLGTLDELRTIAAAVIGGTALAGGIGTIYGAVLGALIMQSLQSGMAMVGVDAPLQSHRHRHRAGLRGLGRHHLPAEDRGHDDTPLVELRDIRISFGGVHAVDHVTVDLYPGRGGRPARPQRRRQVDADQGALRRLPCRHRRDPRRRREGRDPLARATHAATTSRRSTRRSRWPTT